MIYKSIFARKTVGISTVFLMSITLITFSNAQVYAEEFPGKGFDLDQLKSNSLLLSEVSDLQLLRSEGDFGLIEAEGEFAVASMAHELTVLDKDAIDTKNHFPFFIAFSDRVEIGWYEVSNRVSDYFVYRDGELIGEVKDSLSFVDTKPVTSGLSEYRVEVDTVVPEEEWEELISGEELELTSAGEIAPPERGHILVYPDILLPDPGMDATVEVYDTQVAKVAAATYTTVRWAAFISNDYVYRDPFMSSIAGCPVYGIPGSNSHTWFQGDNRSWNSSTSSSANKFRVQKVVRKTWGSSSAPVSLNSAAGPTKVYYSLTPTSQKIYFAQATATNVGVNMYQNITSTSVGVQLNFYSRNPWCTTAVRPIEGSVDIGCTQSGYFNASGLIRVVPNHEYYIQWSNGSVKTVFRKTNAGFHCLNSIIYGHTCGLTSISGSGNGY